MASWMVHLRIADRLLDRIENLDEKRAAVMAALLMLRQEVHFLFCIPQWPV